MKKGYFYFLVITGLMLAGCHKNSLPPSTDNEDSSVFYMKFTANGFPVNIEAGKDNYYMFPTHFQDTSNVYVYKGELKQKDCNGSCGYGISILINDYTVSQINGVMYPDSGLYVGEYQFNDGSTEPAYYMGYFTPTYTVPGTGYYWSYSDGTTQSGDMGVHKFRNKTKAAVRLNVNASTATFSLANEYRIGNALQCNVVMQKDTPATALRYLFTPQPTYYNPNSTCVWKFYSDDNSFSYLTGDKDPSQLFPASGYYNAHLTLTSGTDVCDVNYQVPAFFNLQPHANWTSTFVPVPNPKRLSSITFVVTDPTGHVYSTGMINQSTNNKVEILSVEDYQTTDSGEPTKKLKIKFNCTMKDLSNNNTLNITDGEAIIAVSYK